MGFHINIKGFIFLIRWESFKKFSIDGFASEADFLHTLILYFIVRAYLRLVLATDSIKIRNLDLNSCISI